MFLSVQDAALHANFTISEIASGDMMSIPDFATALELWIETAHDRILSRKARQA